MPAVGETQSGRARTDVDRGREDPRDPELRKEQDRKTQSCLEQKGRKRRSKVCVCVCVLAVGVEG